MTKESNTRNLERDELLLVLVLFHRNEPIPPGLVNALKEHLGYPTDDELIEMIQTGKARVNSR